MELHVNLSLLQTIHTRAHSQTLTEKMLSALSIDPVTNSCLAASLVVKARAH